MAKAFDISKFRKTITKSIDGLGIGFNAGQFRFIFDHVDDTDIFSIQYSF